MWFGGTLLVSNCKQWYISRKENFGEEKFYSSSGHSLLLSHNLFSFQLPELWKSKYFNKLAQEHCSVLDTSVSLMLRSSPAPAFSYTAVCTSSNQSLFHCHFFVWGSTIMDGKEMHQQLPVHYHDSFYFVCSQDERTGIDSYSIIKYWGMKQDAALCIFAMLWGEHSQPGRKCFRKALQKERYYLSSMPHKADLVLSFGYPVHA